MLMDSREMIKHLKDNRFAQISQNGPHIKMRNEETGKQVVVPYHSNL